jgi:hypothetical protein
LSFASVTQLLPNVRKKKKKKKNHNKIKQKTLFPSLTDPSLLPISSTEHPKTERNERKAEEEKEKEPQQQKWEW